MIQDSIEKKNVCSEDINKTVHMFLTYESYQRVDH